MRISGQRILGWHKTVKYRINMRNNPTPAEAVLWECLKDKKLHGLLFRRQHGVGPYIADFYHAPTKTIIELDGEIHNDPEVKINDKEREEYLKGCGYNIIRFQNNHVFNDLDDVLKKILRAVLPSEARTAIN